MSMTILGLRDGESDRLAWSTVETDAVFPDSITVPCPSPTITFKSQLSCQAPPLTPKHIWTGVSSAVIRVRFPSNCPANGILRDIGYRWIAYCKRLLRYSPRSASCKNMLIQKDTLLRLTGSANIITTDQLLCGKHTLPNISLLSTYLCPQFFSPVSRWSVPGSGPG